MNVNDEMGLINMKNVCFQGRTTIFVTFFRRRGTEQFSKQIMHSKTQLREKFQAPETSKPNTPTIVFKKNGLSPSLLRILPLWTFTDCVTGQGTFLFRYFPVCAIMAVVTSIAGSLGFKCHAFPAIFALCS